MVMNGNLQVFADCTVVRQDIYYLDNRPVIETTLYIAIFIIKPRYKSLRTRKIALADITDFEFANEFLILLLK
jgi:hypothetical protein